MKVVGVIVEYNPFHIGHAYHLEQTRELTQADVIIAVLSGNFVQRGEPSIISKEVRCKEALKQGVNLIVELPYLYAVQSADIFAFSALSLLHDLQVSTIVFGAESGPTSTFLSKYQKKDYHAPQLDDFLKEYLRQGFSYPKAKSLAFYHIHDFYLENPNDILGFAYLEAIRKHNLPIDPIVIKRESSYHNDALQRGVSAKAIRHALAQREDVSTATSMHLPFENLHFLDDYFPYLKHILLTIPPQVLQKIHLVDEGIEYLFIKQIKIATSMRDFITKCTSKRYSGARITRTICHVLTHTTKEIAQSYLQQKPPYIRVLGMDQVGQKHLATIRKSTQTPIISRFAIKKNPLLQLELQATGTYFMIKDTPTQIREYKKERTIYPIIRS